MLCDRHAVRTVCRQVVRDLMPKTGRPTGVDAGCQVNTYDRPAPTVKGVKNQGIKIKVHDRATQLDVLPGPKRHGAGGGTAPRRRPAPSADTTVGTNQQKVATQTGVYTCVASGPGWLSASLPRDHKFAAITSDNKGV